MYCIPYLLRPPPCQPHLLQLLEGLAALQVLSHRHLLAVEGEPGDVGRVACLVLVAPLLEEPGEVRDAEPAPAGLDGGAVQQDVLWS